MALWEQCSLYVRVSTRELLCEGQLGPLTHAFPFKVKVSRDDCSS